MIDAGDATLPRKASKEWDGYPYRKPTQVGEEKILRRKCDPPFRNSANWPRNLGIRGAYVFIGRSEMAQPTV